MADWIKNKAIHPYMGFAYIPVERDGELFGEFGARDSVFNISDNQIAVALSGGSVAQGLYKEAREVLAHELSSIPEFEGKEIVIQPVSMGGLKQPQQLMALAYNRVQGRRVDLWINLDGFNEIALPLTENAPSGVALVYPRSWLAFVRSTYQPDLLDAIVEIRESRRRREHYREVFRFPLARYSASALFIWSVIDDRFESEIHTLDARIAKLNQLSELPDHFKGPKNNFSGHSEAIAECVRIWKASSFEMAALCKASSIPYFHFLQPNQYVRGSKVFTDEELRIAIAHNQYPYRLIVESGYPLLIEGGHQLQEMGVEFNDLTGIYGDESDTIYIDFCCHVNETGYQMMAREMGRAIVRAYQAP